ncbi:FAD:protein FMN transferase [Alienimonas californiensis]|uniref:FAD:protein FMN transferase n=1 Tax=Alienimonas californiensis TaxID=2527989 RepID=A0A517PCZ3_9PLAN|nr:FAD:protein FMN transferase [Alienimonas californiensis]QDT17253.1 Thiamine biosynthesis lipoprotein ApbE precursor [Alienimonas californiensis]
MGSFILTAVVAAGLIEEPAGEATAPTWSRVRVEQVQMGSPFVFTCYARSEGAAKNACRDAGRSVKELTAALSDYHDASELNRLCDNYVAGTPVPASSDLRRALSRAREVSAASGGAFDVTVGPLVKRWRRVRRTGELPPPEELAALRERVDWQAVTVDNAAGTVTIHKPGVRLDLGGIAKGYAADEAGRVLREQGITRFLIDAGGDLLAGDPPPGEAGWAIGLPDPRDADAPPTEFLTLAHAAVATSGDAFKHTEIDGVRYSHLVDPRTGLGLTDRSTVTVIGPNGMTADAYASAVSVLGPEAGVALLNRTPNVEGRATNEAGTTDSHAFPLSLGDPGRRR